MGNSMKRLGMAAVVSMVVVLMGSSSVQAGPKIPRQKPIMAKVANPQSTSQRGASAIAKKYNPEIKAAKKRGDLAGAKTLKEARKKAISNFAHNK